MTNETYMCAESIVQTWFINIRSKSFWDMLGIKAYSTTLLGALFTSRKTRKLQYIINLEYLAALTSATVKYKQHQAKRINCDEVINVIITRGIYQNKYYYDMGLKITEAAKEFAASVEYYNNSIVNSYRINKRILSKISYNEEIVDGCATMLELYIIKYAYPPDRSDYKNEVVQQTSPVSPVSPVNQNGIPDSPDKNVIKRRVLYSKHPQSNDDRYEYILNADVERIDNQLVIKKVYFPNGGHLTFENGEELIPNIEIKVTDHHNKTHYITLI